MSYTASVIEREAERTKDTRTAKVLKALVPSLRAQPAPWEVDLIARLTVVARVFIEQGLEPYADIVEAVTVVAGESGGYWNTHNVNEDGTSDIGVAAWNDVHRYALQTRLSVLSSLGRMSDRVKQNYMRNEPLFNQWNASRETERMNTLRPYAKRAVAIAQAPHPTKPYKGII
jgi:hypothetical protein